MERVVKIEIEEIPEVTENDIYLDIDGIVEEAEQYMHMKTVDTKSPVIKQERISPLPWQGNQNICMSFTGQHLNNRNVASDAGHGVKYNPFIKKISALSDPNEDDEEIDVDTPYCEKLKGQTQEKNEPNVAYSPWSSELLQHIELARVLTSKSTSKRKFPHSSLTVAKKSTSKSCRSSLKQTKSGVARQSKTTVKPSSKAVSNVAKKSTSKQSKLTRKSVRNTLSDVREPTVTEPFKHYVGGLDSNVISNIVKSSTTKRVPPDVTQSASSAFKNVAKKSTSKRAKSYLSTSNFHSQISKSNSKIVGPALYSITKSLPVAAPTVIYHGVEDNELDRDHSSEILVPCPDKLTAIEKPQSDLTRMAFESQTTPAHNLHQEVSSQATNTMFDFTEKSSKRIACPECCDQVAQCSLKGHLETVHSLQLKSCAKCKIGFTDLNQYSEHYAFHLQEEEDQIADILQSPFSTNSRLTEQTGFVQQRLTRKQREQFMTKRKHTAIVTGRSVASDKDEVASNKDKAEFRLTASLDRMKQTTDFQRGWRSRSQSGSRSSSPAAHTPTAKRQRLEGHILNDKVTVSLVSLEAASQPFNCSVCLKAFRTALACPQSFRQYIHQGPLSCSLSPPGFVHSDQLGLQQELPCSVASHDKNYPENKTKDESSSVKAVAVSSMNSPVTLETIQDGDQASSERENVVKSDVYECKVCDKKFLYHSRLLRHTLYHTDQFVCGFCRKAYKQKADLFDHFELMHRGQIRFRCKYCKRKFEDLVHFETHIKDHKDGTVVKCTVCNMKYSSSKQMLLHLKNSHGPCDVCGQKFITEKEFVNHMRIAHVELPKQTVSKALHCRMCARVFQTVPGLLSHKRHHHAVTSTSFSARSVGLTRSRSQSHTNVSIPQLSDTNSEGDNKSVSVTGAQNTASHQKPNVVTPNVSPTIVEEVKVPVTPKVSPTIVEEVKVPVSRQDKMITSHSDYKRNSTGYKSDSVKCRVCYKILCSVDGLKKHYSLCHKEIPLSKHSTVGNDRLHPCPKCDKHFIHHSSVLRHIRLDHRRTHISSKGFDKQKSNSHKCRKCGREFSIKARKPFLAHTQVCNGKQSSGSLAMGKDCLLKRTCMVCEKSFAWEKNVIRHMIVVHHLTREEISCNMSHKNFVKTLKSGSAKSHLYLCKVCKECFTGLKSYKLHQVNRHGGKSDKFQCRFCRKVLTRNDRLLLHIMTRHQGKLPYLCRGCNQEFSTSERLFMHKCSFCHISKDCRQKNEQSSQEVTKTFQTEGPGYRYRCVACNIGFYIAREWTKHMQMHFDGGKEDITSNGEVDAGTLQEEQNISNYDIDSGNVSPNWMHDKMKRAPWDGELGLDIQDELSLHAFEDLYEMAWNAEFLIDANSVSMQLQTEGNTLEKEISLQCENTVCNRPESIAIGTLDPVEDWNNVTGDLSTNQILSQLEQDVCTKTNQTPQQTKIQENTAGVQQVLLANHESVELIVKSREEVAGTLKEKFIPAGEIQEPLLISRGESEHVAYRETESAVKRPANCVCETTPDSTEHREKEAADRPDRAVLERTAVSVEHKEKESTHTPVVEHKEKECTHTAVSVEYKEKESAHTAVVEHKEKECTYTAVSVEYKEKESAHTAVSVEYKGKEFAHIAVSVEHKEKESAHTAVPVENREKESAHTDVSTENKQKESAHTAVPVENREKESAHTDVSVENKEKESAHTAVSTENKQKGSAHTAVSVEHKESVYTAVYIEHKQKESAHRQSDESVHENTGVPGDQTEQSADRRQDESIHKNVTEDIEHREKEPLDRRPDRRVLENTAEPVEHRDKSTDRRPDESVDANRALCAEQRKNKSGDRRPDGSMHARKVLSLEHRKSSADRTSNRSVNKNITTVAEQREEESVDRRQDNGERENVAAPAEHRENKLADRSPDGSVLENLDEAVEHRDEECADSDKSLNSKSMVRCIFDLFSLTSIFPCHICKKIFTDEKCFSMHQCNAPGEQNKSHASLNTEDYFPELIPTSQPLDECSKYESRDECTAQTPCRGKVFSEKENIATCSSSCTSKSLDRCSKVSHQELAETIDGPRVFTERSLEVNQNQTENRHGKVDQVDNGSTELYSISKHKDLNVVIKAKISSVLTASSEISKCALGKRDKVSVSEKPKLQNMNKELYGLNTISNNSSYSLTDTSENQASVPIDLSENSCRCISDNPLDNQNQQNEQPQSLEQETQDQENWDSALEGQSKKLQGTRAEQQQINSDLGPSEATDGAHKNPENNCMQKCVSVLRQKLTFKKDIKLVRKEDDATQSSEDTYTSIVQNTQGVPFHENRTAAVKHRDSSSDASRKMGPKHEARRLNIFDIISSKKQLTCPVCEKACIETELSQHYCTVSVGQNNAHASLPTKEMGTELATDTDHSGKTTELKGRAGCSQTTGSDLCDQTLNISKEQNKITCHTLPGTPGNKFTNETNVAFGEIGDYNSHNHNTHNPGNSYFQQTVASPGNNSSNEINTVGGETDDHNTQNPGSSYSAQTASVSENLTGQLEDMTKQVTQTLTLPPQKDVNWEENKSQVGIFVEQQENVHCRHTNMAREVCETHSENKNVSENVTENNTQETVGKENDLAHVAFIHENKDQHLQDTQEGRPGKSIHDSKSAAGRYWDKSSGGGRMVESKYQGRLNIFDMLSSKTVNCLVFEKPCTVESPHSQCQGVSAEQSISHSSSSTVYFDAEQTGASDETYVNKATFNLDKNEDGVKDLDTADFGNCAEWEEKNTGQNQSRNTDLRGYLPVGLCIRNSCTDMLQNQEQTDSMCVALNRVMWGSENDVPDELHTLEKQNDTVFSETTISPDARVHSFEHHAVCRLNEETGMNKITGNNESVSDLNSQVIQTKTSTTGLVTEKLQSLEQCMPAKTQEKQNLCEENQNEHWDEDGKENQFEESHGMTAEKGDYTDCRPTESEEEVQKGLTVQRYIRDFSQEKARDQDEECCRKRYLVSVDTAAADKRQHAEWPFESIKMDENQTAGTEHSSPDSNKEMKTNHGKRDARSNIFDILSLGSVSALGDKNGVNVHVCNMSPKQNTSHPSLLSKDWTAAEPTDFSRQTVASDIGAHDVSHDIVDHCSKTAETKENTNVQNQAANFCDSQTESEIREQLSELLLNSQQNPAEGYMADSITKPSGSGFDRQGKPSVGLAQILINSQSDPARCTKELMKKPYENVTDCKKMVSSLRPTQQKSNPFQKNKVQGTNNCGIDNWKHVSVHGIEAEQNDYSRSRSVDCVRGAQEKITNNGMQRYIQSLRGKFTLDEDLVHNKMEARLGHTAEESEEHFMLGSPGENQSEDTHGNQTTSLRKRKRNFSQRNGEMKAARVKTDSRLNIFDVLSK